MSPLLTARALLKTYGRGDALVRAVDDVDLDVGAGETVAIMGPSGCGKSTVLHLLGGLDRHPRRAALSAASTAVTVTGVVAVIAAHHAANVETGRFDWFAGLSDPVTGRVNQVMAVLTVVLITLAAVNAIVTGWATALDARQPTALARALGGTPWQITIGLAAAQALAALPGALIGVPLGILLFTVANGAQVVSVPPASWLASVVLGALAAVAALTAIPAGIGARQAVVPILQSGTA